MARGAEPLAHAQISRRASSPGLCKQYGRRCAKGDDPNSYTRRVLMFRSTAMRVTIGSANGVARAWWRRQTTRGKLRTIAFASLAVVVAIPLLAIAFLFAALVAMIALALLAAAMISNLFRGDFRLVRPVSPGRENVRVVR